jgi:hypothetical protein
MVHMRVHLRFLATSGVLATALLSPAAATAEPVGSPFTLAESRVVFPHVAGGAGRYIATWRGGSTTARLVGPGTLMSEPFGVPGSGGEGDVAFSASQRHWVVVTTDGTNVRATVVRGDGSTGATSLVWTAAAGEQLETPRVAHQPSTGQFLTAWVRVRPTGSHVMTRRLDANAVPIGDQYRAADLSLLNQAPDVAPGPSGGWIVVWHRRDADYRRYDVYAQRLTSDNAETGTDDLKVSSHTNLTGQIQNREPAVTWNPGLREWLVVFSDAHEVFGQRLSSSGSRRGGNFRLSSMGPDGDRRFHVSSPDVSYSATADQYLVVWDGNDRLIVEDERESFPVLHVFGQRLSAATSQIGTDDFQISTVMRTDIDADPALAANPSTREFLTVWHHNGEAILGRYVAAP